MKRRYDPEELFKLRNNLPVGWLIKQVLKLEENTRSCFKCPCCGSFQTSINRTTNLARCFRCQRNFNPIDLVIACHRLGFTESVEFLRKCNPLAQEKNKQPRLHPQTEPLAVKEILRRIVNSSGSKI